MATARATIVVALGAAQTIAWASSYYMPAILGGPIANSLDLSTSVFFGLFSAALLLSAHRRADGAGTRRDGARHSGDRQQSRDGSDPSPSSATMSRAILYSSRSAAPARCMAA